MDQQMYEKMDVDIPLEDAKHEEPGADEVLDEFLQKIENYKPSFPECLVENYLKMSGFQSQDPRITKLIALASQKFISDVANDALQHCKMQTSSQTNQSTKNPKVPKEKKFVMSIEHLSPALQERGINIKKPHYYV